MRLRALLALTLPTLLLGGCGSAPAPERGTPSAAPPAAAPPRGAVFAPFPYTAEQIRDATQRGRTYVFRVRQQGKELRQRMVFAQVDADGATIRTTIGEVGEAQPQGGESRSTWQQLVQHASYPASFTTITPVELTVEAGAFATKLYEVVDGDGAVVTRAWFADDLPGAPVKMENYADGEAVFVMELVEHDAGGESPQTAPAG